MLPLDLKLLEGALSLRVRAKPRATRTKVVGVKEGCLEVSLAAPPVDGAANAELCRFLSRELKIARGRVNISGGATGKQKRVTLTGVTEAELREYLDRVLASKPVGD